MEIISSAVIETMVNSFTDADELLTFAMTWGLLESPTVRLRLFQLRNPEYSGAFVNEELDNILQSLGGPTTQNVGDFELVLEFVREQDEVEESIKAIFFDDEMEALGQTYVEDDEWSPTVQLGGGDEPQPGPAHRHDTPPPQGLRYKMRKKSERTYAKNAAVDRTYQVKVDDYHHGERLEDIRDGLHQMFDQVLNGARGDLAGNDLGRVIIQHEGWHDPIVIPLQPWDQLNADVVMRTIEKVLNSNQNLSVDERFGITIGSVDLPKGGARRRITKIKRKNNSLQLKKSIKTIENDDQLCMAKAISVSWAKLKRCTKEEWLEIIKNSQKKSSLQLVLEHQRVPESYYKNLMNKKRDEQQQLAVAISQLAGVSIDRPASLNQCPSV